MARICGRLVLVAALLFPFVLVAAGGWLWWEREHGPRIRVTIESCSKPIRTGPSYRQGCVGHWRRGGRELEGPVVGASSSQEGQTIDATQRGGTAYSESPALAFLLVGLSIPCWAVPARWATAHAVRRSAP